MTPIRTVCLILAALTFSGCSAVSALNDAGTALEAYELAAPTDLPATQGSLQRDLIIEEPTSGGGLDTDRIMIRPRPLQAQYLPASRWTDSAPVLLQNLMLRSFQDTNALRYVGRRPLGGSGDFVLVTELTDLQAELGPTGEEVLTRIRFTVRLVRESDAAILGSRTIERTAAAASTEPLAVVQSLDLATSAALQDLVGWALRLMGLRVTG